jgi:hypothetical protein
LLRLSVAPFGAANVASGAARTERRGMPGLPPDFTPEVTLPIHLIDVLHDLPTTSPAAADDVAFSTAVGDGAPVHLDVQVVGIFKRSLHWFE